MQLAYVVASRPFLEKVADHEIHFSVSAALQRANTLNRAFQRDNGHLMPANVSPWKVYRMEAELIAE